MEIKIKTQEPPSPAEAQMLLTWIGEYYPGMVLPTGATEPTPEELVDAGELDGVQTEIPYDPETGEILSVPVRCGGCQGPLRSIDDDCTNPDCEYNVGEDGVDDEDGEE